MQRSLITIILFILTTPFYGQSDIAGLWKTPKAPAAMHYQFDSTGTMKYNFYSCLSGFQRTGHYLVKRDSVFISYDSLTTLEKQIYQVKTNPPAMDTLYIVDNNRIKINNDLYIFKAKEFIKPD